nr:type II toxin-antitoxin system VapC family toxin [uncultured Devosia sp.]
MKYYLDTSIAVSLLSEETNSEIAIAWMENQQARDITTSYWLVTEFHAALARKRRKGVITDLEFAGAIAAFSRTLLPLITFVDISQKDFQLAADICRQHSVGLRGPDALHLAVSISNDATLATLDKAFAAGALALGYKAHALI